MSNKLNKTMGFSSTKKQPFLNNLLLSCQGSSYLLKHRQRIQKTPPQQPLYKTIDNEINNQLYKIIPAQRQYQETSLQYKDNEEQTLYNDYLDMQKNYSDQLKQIQNSIKNIEDSNEKQQLKVKEAERILKQKKKYLGQLRQAYQISVRTSSSQNEEGFTEQVQVLKQKLKKIKQDSETQIQKMQQQLQSIQLENQQLELQLFTLEQQLELDNKNILSGAQYDQIIKKLEQEESQLRKQINDLEAQSEILKKNAENIIVLKPLDESSFKKQLQIFEKIYINKQLEKAEQILKQKQLLKQQEENLKRKKLELEALSEQLTAKEKIVEQHKKTIDQLSYQIVQKSTILLNIYSEGSLSPTKRANKRISYEGQ